MADVGLRERKKAATRTLIMETADRLFLERGFENVTLDEVAEACDVSVRTVLRYFATKEALALAEDADALERLRTGLAKRTGGVLDYWRYYVGMISAEIAGRPEWYRRHFAMIRRHPLHVAALHFQREAQHLLAAALSEELDTEDRLAPYLLAAALIAGNEVVITDWVQGRRRFDPEALLEVVDYTTSLFADRIKPRAAGRRSRR